MGKPDNWVKKGFQQDVKRVCSPASCALNPEFSPPLTPHHPHPFKSQEEDEGAIRAAGGKGTAQPPVLIPREGPRARAVPGLLEQRPRGAGLLCQLCPRCHPRRPARHNMSHPPAAAPAARGGVGGQRCLCSGGAVGTKCPIPLPTVSLWPRARTRFPNIPLIPVDCPRKLPRTGCGR